MPTPLDRLKTMERAIHMLMGKLDSIEATVKSVEARHTRELEKLSARIDEARFWITHSDLDGDGVEEIDMDTIPLPGDFASKQ